MGTTKLPPGPRYMESPAEGLFEFGGLEIFYREYGSRDRPAVLALHGLGGQGWNYHRLAVALQPSFRVICPDLIGRGRSQWSEDPQRDYCSERYLAMLGHLLDELGVGSLSWIGTSMGGAIAIRAAGGDWRDRVTCLVLNDIGPELPPRILTEISAVAGASPEFPSFRALADHLAGSLGELAGRSHDSEHWLRFALAGGRRTDGGALALHHDPKVAVQLQCHPDDYALWEHYDRIRCPTLVIRGALSTILTAEVADAMTSRGPKARVLTLASWGHAPFLDADEQIGIVGSFLEQCHASLDTSSKPSAGE